MELICPICRSQMKRSNGSVLKNIIHEHCFSISMNFTERIAELKMKEKIETIKNHGINPEKIFYTITCIECGFSYNGKKGILNLTSY